MSKLLFSADWHIKLGQKNVPKEWQINRFRMLFEQLHYLEEEVTMHVIAGDIFDSTPSLEELKLFVEYLLQVNIPTFIFDGNHEASRKGHTFFEQLKPIFENLNKKVFVILGVQELAGMDIIPYTDLKKFKSKDFKNKILLTHVRGNIPPHVKMEINLEKLDRWDLVLAGDLHSHSNSQRNIVYPGSPMNVTFHRKETKTGVIKFDNETAEYEWMQLNLPQLIRKTVDNEEDMIQTTFNHTIYELTGDLDKLTKAQKINPLLDKKIIKRTVDASIDFSTTDTVEEELLLFLKEVKGIKDTDKIMKVFNDNIQAT